MATLMLEFVRAGHDVLWAIAGSGKDTDILTHEQLSKSGARFIGDFTDDLDFGPRSAVGRRLSVLRQLAIPRLCEVPRFRDRSGNVDRLIHSGADVALLFWDTWFEFLLPYLARKIPVVGYLGRPRYASALTGLEQHQNLHTLRERLSRVVARKLLKQQRNAHLRRARNFARLGNICAVDATMYGKTGIPCSYVPNTWPDMFGAEWESRRARAVEQRGRLGILANVGTLSTTGNAYGLSYLATEVLPELEPRMNGVDYEINICGGGHPGTVIGKLFQHPRVNAKGFVQDIDQEMLANSIFLLLNNAGPYTGGYTRVMYAFASGACLIAHSRLAESMPEVRDGINALLGQSGREISALIAQVSADDALRRRLGKAARQTYECEYHPRVVGRKLLVLLKESLRRPHRQLPKLVF